MLNFKRALTFTALLLTTVLLSAQPTKVNSAAMFLQQGSLDSAKFYIDAATTNAATQNSGKAWYLRGFVYKTIYNKNEKTNKKSPARIIGLSSFKQSLKLDRTQENVQKNIKNIKYLYTTLYNAAAESRDSVH